MKKLMLAISIALVIASCKESNKKKINSNDSLNVKAEMPHPSSPPNGITLNGVSWSNANKMVSDFMSDSSSSDPKTTIWLSKNWVDSVYKALTNEQDNNVGTDGFRIYFAKRLDNISNRMRNTIVIVSTRSDGDDAAAESLKDHLDYYEHSSPFLQKASQDRQLTEDWNGDPNATLLYYGNRCCADDNCSIAAINNIPCIDAYNAVINFVNLNPNLINTHSEWFSLDLLQALKEELDAALSQAPTPIPADGIRIYFAKNTTSVKNPKHQNRHSFIIVTTKADTVNGRAIHKDYFQCYNPKNNYLKKQKNDFYSNDNGEQCPNNCKGTTLP